ncbi:HDOD domain-containing protein [Thiocystis violascens]|uniref:Putative signal transduction protein n=1 Tax=Thiocystis violascens (strain ATCC 17096 / DSM 198 / 6111) TaxID=765911 RepID=I3Y8L4_THIV6|nr:HDOD domain-containing protein [Thiocystis violascens]AFL73332.1 putative signal transduction protein [Thiocystis violascens DSM 198]
MTMPFQRPIASLYPPKAALETAFQAVRKARVPQIPDVVLALRAELNRSEPNVKVVADLIAQDLALAGQILKKVNAPIFARRAKIASVQQAVMLLGIDQLVNLVTAAVIERMLGDAKGSARVVWESIMEQARVATTIAGLVECISSEEAYLFGLMHDVGSLIFADLLENYGYEWVLRFGSPQSLMEHERAALGVDHATVGFLLASTWQLPEHLALAIYHRHAFDYRGLEDSRVRSLIAVSQLGRYLIALALGNHEQPELLTYRDHARQELALDEDEWAALCKQAQEGGWSPLNGMG